MMKFKIIRQEGKAFLCRLSIYLKVGSIKLHLILKDDVGEMHTHPWDFTSLILFGGYVEETIEECNHTPWRGLEMYHEQTTYGWLSVNKKAAKKLHKVRLRRLYGITIPTLTIGFYGAKKQLCSLCKEQGYCSTTGKPI